jgi:hypothetical protein
MNFYIHPLKGIFHPSHRKIYSLPALIPPLYHPLSTGGPLVTLSKYIHVESSFDEFIETNLMVQSEFNLAFWFVSYNIFLLVAARGPHLSSPLSLPCSLCGSAGAWVLAQASVGRPPQLARPIYLA